MNWASEVHGVQSSGFPRAIEMVRGSEASGAVKGLYSHEALGVRGKTKCMYLMIIYLGPKVPQI